MRDLFFQKRSIIFIFLILVLVFFLFLVVSIKRKQPSSTEKEKSFPSPAITPVKIEKSSPFPSLIISQFIPSEIIPTFTGAKEEKESREEIIVTEKYNELRKKVPIETEDFQIRYDYEEGKFVVIFKKPFEVAQNKFSQWLIDNGFDEIPKDDFDFR